MCCEQDVRVAAVCCELDTVDDWLRQCQVMFADIRTRSAVKQRPHHATLNQRWTWVGSIHGLGWVGLNEKYCGIVAEYCKTHTFHLPSIFTFGS